jgi:hypothetical protein
MMFSRLWGFGLVVVAFIMPSQLAQAQDAFLPPEAREVLDEYRAAEEEIRLAAEIQLNEVREKMIARLQPLQDRYTREAKLDEAVAIRDLIARLKLQTLPIEQDPGTPGAWVGGERDTYYVRVTGAIGGSIWGTDEYTTDSSIAAAAVHAGILESGMTGILKLRLLPGRDAYKGSDRNGVTTRDWGAYGSSYRLEKVEGLRRLPPGAQMQPQARGE